MRYQEFMRAWEKGFEIEFRNAFLPEGSVLRKNAIMPELTTPLTKENLERLSDVESKRKQGQDDLLSWHQKIEATSDASTPRTQPASHLQPAPLQSQSKLKLAKESAIKALEPYAKDSFFFCGFRTHQDRARQVINAIGNAKSVEAIRDILNHQKQLFVPESNTKASDEVTALMMHSFLKKPRYTTGEGAFTQHISHALESVNKIVPAEISTKSASAVSNETSVATTTSSPPDEQKFGLK